MNQRDILKKIKAAAKAAGVEYDVREGGNHTIVYLNGHKATVVSRAPGLPDQYAQVVYKQCETDLGKGWWR